MTCKLLADTPPAYTYQLHNKDHQIYQKDQKDRRKVSVWRTQIDEAHKETNHHLLHNDDSEIGYELQDLNINE
jgi:hypothetical protein